MANENLVALLERRRLENNVLDNYLNNPKNPPQSMHEAMGMIEDLEIVIQILKKEINP